MIFKIFYYLISDIKNSYTFTFKQCLAFAHSKDRSVPRTHIDGLWQSGPADGQVVEVPVSDSSRYLGAVRSTVFVVQQQWERFVEFGIKLHD